MVVPSHRGYTLANHAMSIRAVMWAETALPNPIFRGGVGGHRIRYPFRPA